MTLAGTAEFWKMYAAVALPFWVLDAIWLGIATSRFYRPALGPLMAKKVKPVPAIVFYVAYPAGLALFVLATYGAGSVSTAFGYGGLFGLFCYGTYDLVNHSTIAGWPLRVTLGDMAWGTIASAAACATARLILG